MNLGFQAVIAKQNFTCSLGTHDFPVSYLNIDQFIFNCSPVIIGMRYIHGLCILVIFFDLRCESVTCISYAILCDNFDVTSYI